MLSEDVWGVGVVYIHRYVRPNDQGGVPCAFAKLADAAHECNLADVLLVQPL